MALIGLACCISIALKNLYLLDSMVLHGVLAWYVARALNH